MVITSNPIDRKTKEPTITWEKLPDDFQLEDEPVESTAQPLLAGALRESLELAGYIQPEMLIASNFGICAKINGDLVIKAPDWVYIAVVKPLESTSDRKSYTPHLQGETPTLVMEFLSETDGGEYSVKPTYPPGKWLFYEQILKVPLYIIFNPSTGVLEIYRLQGEHYKLEDLNPEQKYLIPEMGLFLGVWQGNKEQRNGYWLRWWDESGNLLLWGVELLEQERQRAEQERQRADKLAAYLRSQDINPEEIG